MSATVIELTEEEFDKQYPLVENHLNASAGWAFGEGNGRLFNTFGTEFEFVKRQDRRRVFTLVDGDDGDLYLVSGFHLVNRVGYLLSRDPIPVNSLIQVHIPMQSNDQGDDA